jgi:signal peptidase II
MVRFLTVAMIAMGIDLATKAVAANALGGGDMVSISERLAFLLVYNTGTAGGASIGPYTWLLNVTVTLFSLGLVMGIVKALAEVDSRSTLPLALVSGGALGNLASMVTGPEGVADFIAVQVTDTSTVVLNVADVWLWSGALLLVPVVIRLVGAVRAEQRSRRSV